MRDTADDAAAPRRGEPEDVIGSPPDRLDNFWRWVTSLFPQSFDRSAVLIVAVVAALIGLVMGHLTAPSSDRGPAGIASGPPTEDFAAPLEAVEDQLGRGLLTLIDLARIGEPASGGTYTLGSASALPDPCSDPAPGDTGVRYLPGPIRATAVSFQLVGATLTQRITTLSDDVAARQRLQVVVSRARDCRVDPAARVELGLIGPGVGDEYVQAVVTRSYPSGTTTRQVILLVRVGAVLVEFSLGGPGAAGPDAGARCHAIARAGLTG